MNSGDHNGGADLVRATRATLLHRTRMLVRRAGLDFTRFPAASPDYRAFKAFTSVKPEVILDVGANDGGFARQCRDFGYRGPIVSFEPGAQAYERLARALQHDLQWQAHRLALGAQPCECEMALNVTANAGASSSLLEMLPSHAAAAPDALPTHLETVRVRRLDDWVLDTGADWARIALKIDTQGYERQVLEGAGGLLDGAVRSIQLELSLVPLYADAWLWGEAVEWLESRGFELAGLTPGFSDPRTGRLLQFDGVFLRV